MKGELSPTPARWPRSSAVQVGAQHQQLGLLGERRWLPGFQRAQHRERAQWQRSPVDRAHTPKSCDPSPRSPQQRSDSWQRQSRLLDNAFEGAWGEVVAGLTRNRNAPRLMGMLELPVATACSDKHPASQLQLIDHLANLHGHGLAAPQWEPDSRAIEHATVKPRNACQEALP